jgi:hypothetical protein
MAVNKLCKVREVMPPVILQISSMLLLLWLPVSGSGVELGTRQQTILPCSITPGTPGLAPSNVSQYVSSGYGAWNWGPGTNEGRKFTYASRIHGRNQYGAALVLLLHERHSYHR